MKKIIAIGGGEIGKPKKGGGFEPVETTKIDKEIIRQANKTRPKLLFIPTASSDSHGYFDVVKKHFSKLGCNVDVLYLLGEKYSKKELENKIFSSDIIYVGGGNTLKMMRVWRKFDLDKILKKAHEKGIVLSGLSAGAICWFSKGCSDSKKFTSNSSELIKVTGLGLVDALFCPHFDSEKHRQKALKEMMKKTPLVGLGFSDCCAIEIIDNKFRVLKSRRGANAYKLYWKKDRYFCENIPSIEKFKDLRELVEK